MTQALQGIRVLDFTQVEMGPVCTQVLGDFGADVVKVERRDSGDISRGKPLPVEGESPVFLSLNRNKRGLAVDLKQSEGKAIILGLVDRSDVLVHNFRPEVMAKLGLGYGFAGIKRFVGIRRFLPESTPGSRHENRQFRAILTRFAGIKRRLPESTAQIVLIPAKPRARTI